MQLMKYKDIPIGGIFCIKELLDMYSGDFSEVGFYINLQNTDVPAVYSLKSFIFDVSDRDKPDFARNSTTEFYYTGICIQDILKELRKQLND